MSSSRSTRRARSLLRLLIACLLEVLTGRAASADGFLRDGMGPIPAGRGATNVAHADNASVLLDNPAALAAIEPGLLAGVHVGQYLFAFGYADAENEAAEGRGSSLPIADAALLIRSRTNERLGYGIGLFVPAGFGADYALRTQPAFGPGEQTYRSFAAFVKLVAGVAYRATDKLSVGAHLGLAGAHVRLRLPYWVQSGALAGAPVRVDLQSTGFAPAWAIGAQYELIRGTVLGASYTAASDFDAGVGGSARVALGGGGAARIAADRFDASVGIGLPRAVALGVRHDVGLGGRLSAELTWRNWSAAFDAVGFDLRRGSGALGVTEVSDQVRFAWNDTWTVGLGYERRLTAAHTLRLGYTHHQSPSPGATLTPVVPVTLEHVVGAGFGWRSGDAQLDLSYQYTFGPTRTVATSRLVGGDFGDSRLTVEGHVWFAGVTWHVHP